MLKIVYLYVFIFSLLNSLLFVFFCKKIALRFNIVDHPDKKRKTHKSAVPLLGGVGIFSAFFTTILFNLLLVFFLNYYSLLPHKISLHLPEFFLMLRTLAIFMFCAFTVMLMGLLDDLKKLPALFKLSFLTLVCAVIFFGGIKISLFMNNHLLQGGLTFFWIIGITNAFNLMDNMDGLCALSALISSFVFFIWSLISSQIFMALILSCFCGVLIGFLFFNFPPAKIFMGDAGSLFVGFSLSVLTIINTYYSPDNTKAITVMMPLIILAIPIFDTMSVIIIRIKNKQSILKADQNHFSHRLLALGLSKKSVLLFISLMNICLGSGALLLFKIPLGFSMFIFIQLVAIILMVMILEKTKK